ncbi:MAG: ABC transporter ATP-binding protein [Armatimonadetes bacterium]|nr:ABC transporter ATP-binding protein [Armatimonadota bacterium]
MTGLRIEDLSHRFGRRILFQDLNLTLAPGEWLAVTGPNGSGKTTLMRILAGLARPTRGAADLLYEGQALAPAERRNAVGLVTPDVVLDPELTALENLRFHARMRGLPSGGEADRLETVGLGGRGEDRVRTFSSGMRQRLKYAFAIQHAPLLLLLDEPTANLDVVGTELVERLRAAQRERGLLVVATNEPHEAEGATHRIHLG